MDPFGYFEAAVAEHGAGVENVRFAHAWGEPLSPHYDLRVIRRRMLVNVRRDGPDDFRFGRALAEHRAAVGADTPPPSPEPRVLQMTQSPARPATPPVFERRVRRKQSHPKRLP